MKVFATSLFLMSLLLVGAVAPVLNGFQIVGGILPNTYIDYAFAQTDDTDTEDTDETDTEDTDETDTEDTDETDTEDTDDADTEDTDDTDTEDADETDTEDTDETDTEDAEDDDQPTNLGQEVSTFVHDSKDQFSAQKEETRALIKQCRELLANAATPETREDIKKQCRADLDALKESYKDLRRAYHDVFKEFRTHVRAILQDPNNDATIRTLNSLAQQADIKDRIDELRIQMREELKDDIKELREQMKAEREKMREEVNKMIEEGTDSETIKEEAKKMREQLKAEQEKMKEQIEQEREKMKEEREKLKEQMNEEREKIKEEAKTEKEKMKAESEEMKKKLEEELEKIKKAREEAQG